jgi:hypothetical protein
MTAAASWSSSPRPEGKSCAGPVHARTIRALLLDPLTPDEEDLLASALARIAAS